MENILYAEITFNEQRQIKINRIFTRDEGKPSLDAVQSDQLLAFVDAIVRVNQQLGPINA